MDRIRAKFSDNDPEGTGSIRMESFGMMMNELELADEEEDENVMEEAFEGLDLDEEGDTMRFEQFLTVARRLYYRKKTEEDRRKMAAISEEQLEEVFNRYKTFN